VTSYLLSHQPVEDFVRKTEVAGLDFLPCGPLPPNPAELIHSQRFRELVSELASKYEAVIFDSPPAGVVTDPLVLASLVDGVVLVAHSEATRRDQLKTVVDGMRAVNASILGVVQSRSTSRSIGYAYYYAKGYRRGGQYRYQYRYQREPDQGLELGEESAPPAPAASGGKQDADNDSHAA
jgi:capsular exopolysaccharide synthesis family protein